VTVSDQPGLNWTVVLRRRPARVVAGRPEGGYTDAFEIVCCDCADHPDMDYRDVSAELQRIRGPYPMAAGVTADEEYLKLHHRPVQSTRGGSACAGGSDGPDD
jgi:hypothetical protein